MGAGRLVHRLIDRGAPVDIKDTRYQSTPLGWVLHGWEDAPPEAAGRFHEVVRHLVTAGATVEPEFLTGEKVRADPRMLAALRGETPL